MKDKINKNTRWKAVESPVFGSWHVREDPEDWDGLGYQSICDAPSKQIAQWIADAHNNYSALQDKVEALKERNKELEEEIFQRIDTETSLTEWVFEAEEKMEAINIADEALKEV